MVKASVSTVSQMVPTAGTVVIEENGRKRRVAVRSYAIVLTEIGGSRVKVVRLDRQACARDAIKTAEQDSPGWRFKGFLPLMDRDFEGGEK